MNSRRIMKAKRIAVIGLSSGTLFLVVLYFIVSCTLLNPAFYHLVFESRAVQASFDDASERISTEGTNLFSGQSLKENMYSLTEGILRFIKQDDMSLSSIQFEGESTQSIRSVVLAAASEKAAIIPEISRIHPFIMAYFMPESENVFTALLIAQKAFKALSTMIPVLGLIALLTLALPEKPAENTKITFISTGIAVILTAIVLMFLQRALFLSPLIAILPDAVITVTPIVRQATAYLFIFTVITGGLLHLAASALSLHAVKRTVNRCSRAVAVMILVMLVLFFILFDNEVFSNTVQAMKAQDGHLQVKVLKAEDGTVHSLTIKLREADTQEPVKNVQLTLTRLDARQEPLQITSSSDAFGDARFILPQGQFLLTAVPGSIPGSFTPFEPVVLSLDSPDSSWYTFNLTYREDYDLRSKTPESENLLLSDRPVPLLK